MKNNRNANKGPTTTKAIYDKLLLPTVGTAVGTGVPGTELLPVIGRISQIFSKKNLHTGGTSYITYQCKFGNHNWSHQWNLNYLYIHTKVDMD